MATKTISRCASCGYPLAADSLGQQVTCPNCGSINEVISQQGVSIPTWLFAGSIGLIAGLVLGPPLIATTEAGAQWMARRAREKLAK
jgi:phage FluMu protein Com